MVSNLRLKKLYLYVSHRGKGVGLKLKWGFVVGNTSDIEIYGLIRKKHSSTLELRKYAFKEVQRGCTKCYEEYRFECFKVGKEESNKKS